MSDSISTTPSLRLPDGARWSCRSCGACCRGYDFGPVEPEIIRRLEQAGIAEQWGPAGQRPFYEIRPGPDDTPLHYLASVDGHCIFLRDDNLCAVHALLGEDAKPSFCRAFPFHVVEDPHKVSVVVRASCGGYHQSAVDGAPLEEHLPALFALPRLPGARRFAPEQVAALPDRAVPLSTWLRWEDRLLEVLREGQRRPVQALVALRQALYALDERQAPPPDPRRQVPAAAAVVELLRRVMTQAVAGPAPDDHRAAMAREALEKLEAALPALARPPAPLSESAAEHLHLLLRSFVMARGFAPLGSVPAGLGAFVLQVRLVQALGEPGPDGTLSADEAAKVITWWTRFTENQAIAGMLRRAAPALVDLFLHVEG